MIKAKSIMHRGIGVRPNATGREIAYKFMSTGYPGLPVVDENKEVIGIVTEFDLLGALREGFKVDEITAERIMSKEPKTVDMDTPVTELIEMMLENNFTMIPVVRGKKMMGVISRSEIIVAYVEPGYFEE